MMVKHRPVCEYDEIVATAICGNVMKPIKRVTRGISREYRSSGFNKELRFDHGLGGSPPFVVVDPTQVGKDVSTFQQLQFGLPQQIAFHNWPVCTPSVPETSALRPPPPTLRNDVLYSSLRRHGQD
jgi:hypothetical protein